MGEQLPSLCNLCHQAVQVVGLHGLVETDDVWVAKPPHQLSFSKQVLPHIVLFDLVGFDNLDSNLRRKCKSFPAECSATARAHLCSGEGVDCSLHSCEVPFPQGSCDDISAYAPDMLGGARATGAAVRGGRSWRSSRGLCLARLGPVGAVSHTHRERRFSGGMLFKTVGWSCPHSRLL